MNFNKDQKNEKREAKKHLKSSAKMSISAAGVFTPVLWFGIRWFFCGFSVLGKMKLRRVTPWELRFWKICDAEEAKQKRENRRKTAEGKSKIAGWLIVILQYPAVSEAENANRKGTP